MNYGYIYKTTNPFNTKPYIGKHQGNFDPTYIGSGGIKLQNAIKKYNRKNFTSTVIAYGDDREELNMLECYYIKKFDSINNGYNIMEGGDGGDTFTNNPDKEIIRERNKKTQNRPEVKKKKSKAVKLAMADPKYKEKQSKIQKINQNRPEVNEKRSKTLKVTLAKPEVKKKQCNATKTRWENQEYKEKTRKAMLGKVRSKEVKKKYSEAQQNKIWINNSKINRFIKSDIAQQCLTNGWIVGKLKVIVN